MTSTINRNNFAREHSQIQAGYPTRIGVFFPVGFRSCLTKTPNLAGQVGLLEVYRQLLSDMLQRELEAFMPSHQFLQLQNLRFKYSDGRYNHTTYTNQLTPRYKQFMYIVENSWLRDSCRDRVASARHRAFWNRIEYNIEVIALYMKEQLQSLKKQKRKLNLAGGNRVTFNKAEHIISGFRPDTYEPIESMLSDSYLQVLNLPPHKLEIDKEFFSNHAELRKLGVAFPFKAMSEEFEVSNKTSPESSDSNTLTTQTFLSVCWLTGHIGMCRKIRFYGSLITANMELINNSSIHLTWLSCIGSYVYSYDPRIAIGKINVTNENKDKLGVDLLPEQFGRRGIRSVQHGHLVKCGFTYCEGSEDWCDAPVTLSEDTSGTRYSLIHASSYFRALRYHNSPYDTLNMVWVDMTDPYNSRAEDIFSSDPEVRFNSQHGNSCAIPFGDRPEKFYGYMRHTKRGILQTTKYAKPKERYYGIEIELERKSRSTDAFIMLTRIIPRLKEIGFVSGTDGSLQHGVEFRSCPQTFSVLKENLEKFHAIVSPYFHSLDTCGVHIHVSRGSLSNYQIGKIIGFVYNSDNNSFIESVSRRGSGRWQEFISGSSFESLEGGRIRLNKRKLNKDNKFKRVEGGKKRLRNHSFTNHGKYTAVNTSHNHTLEFRLFKGSDSVDTTLSYLQFVDALCAYTQTGQVDLPIKSLLRWTFFNAWLVPRYNKYSNLCKRLSIPFLKKKVDTSEFNYPTWLTKQIKKGRVKTSA